MKKIAFYTANIGGYDENHQPFYMDQDIDYYYFTDGDNVPKEYTHVKVTEDMFPEDTPDVQKARLIKANPFKYLPNAEEYELIVWADACFKQDKTMKGLFPLMKGRDLLTMEHPQRDCIYDEANACILMGIGDKEAIQNHYRALTKIPYPAKNGLAATGIMVRRNREEVKNVCRMWEKLLSGDVYRDQLSFDYVCWFLDFEYSTFPFKDRGKYFYNHLHLGKRT